MDDDLAETFSLKTEPDSDTESLGFQSQEENSRSDTILWTQQKTRQLIDLYKNSPELWDAKNYKTSRATREAKMAYFADVFNTTTDEMSRKIHNMRTQYSHQLRKIKRKRARHDGGEVAVQWEYFEALSFLAPASFSDPLGINEGVNVELAEFQAKEEAEFGAAVRANLSLQQSPGTSTKETNDGGIGFTKSTAPRTPDPNPSLPRMKSGPRVAASAPPPLPPSAHPMMWPEEPVPRARTSFNADECQIFGDFVASELRTLRSDESRKKLKRMIQKAILQIGEDEDVNIIGSV